METQIHTQSAKVHEAGEGNDPEVLGEDEVTTVELKKEPTLDVWMGGRGVGQETDQKAIGQPSVQEVQKIRNNTDRIGVNERLVPKRSRRSHTIDTGERPVIDVGNGLNVKLHPGEYSHNREHDHGVGYKSPLDGLPSAIVGVKQSDYTFEEQHDDDP